MTVTGSHRAELSSTDEPTLGRLVADASRDMSTLVHSEIALAKSELRVSIRAGGMGAALLAAAGVFGLLVLILGSFTVVWFLIWAGLDPWWAYLIVTGFYVLVAGILALVGVRKLKQVHPPEKTIATTKEIPQAFKRH